MLHRADGAGHSFFEAFNIGIQVTNWNLVVKEKNNPSDVATESASYPASSASFLFLTTIPRSLPSYALLVIFGTTKVFRARLYRKFWPKRWQRFDQHTTLDTPYQSSEAGRQWYSQSPRIDLKLTTASLRWNQGDKTFAAWESRVLDSQSTRKDEEGQESVADTIEKVC